MSTDDLSDDELFEVLGSRRRRLLLSALADSDDGVPIRELSRTIVAREDGVGRDDPDGDTASVCASLRRTHVPLLAEHDIVEYDADGRVVSAGERADAVLPALREAESEGGRSRWAAGYVAVAVSLGGIVLAHAFRPAVVPGAAVAAATVGAVAIPAVAALGHHYGGDGIGGGMFDELWP
jgi:hypothetical protein